MAASFCEKPTEIRERLNSSRSDDFEKRTFLWKQIDSLSSGEEVRRLVLGWQGNFGRKDQLILSSRKVRGQGVDGHSKEELCGEIL
jgi:hypothetical protein